MVEYRADRVPITPDKSKSGPWPTIALMMVVLALLIGVLFATGFWNAQAHEPKKSPDMKVKVVGAPLPGIVVESNKVMTGTMKIPVDAPALEPRSETDATAK